MRWSQIEIYVFSALAVVFLIVALEPLMFIGLVTQNSAVSNVTVNQKFISVDFSTNLANGISFSGVNSIPAANVNASDNYNGAGSGSSLFINVSTDSSNGVDFCIKSNAGLHDSVGDLTIGVGNESYSNSSTTDLSAPALSAEVPLTMSYIRSSLPTAPGNSTYYRFWLDLPTGTSSGNYNNTVNFKAVETLASC